MATQYVIGKATDDKWYLVAPGTVDVDGLGGVDTLVMGTSLRSSYTFSKAMDGSIYVDSISGASAAFHGTLHNMELLIFNNGKDTMDLRVYFNKSPTGGVSISGTLSQGNILTAISTLTDADGMATTLSYEWKADGVSIPNATNSTFTLTSDQVGKSITVKASYTDGLGNLESASSQATSAIEPAAPVTSITTTQLHATLAECLSSYWKDSNLKLSSVSMIIGSQSAVTNNLGVASLGNVTGDANSGSTLMNFQMSKSPPSSAAEASINLTDVLSCLKIYLGKSSLTGTAAAYGSIAADFNGNGKVELSDVLGILKFYLGKVAASDSKPSWVFVDKTDFVTNGDSQTNPQVIASDGLSIVSSDANPHALMHDFSVSSSVEIVGVLRGDVDGSWIG